MKSKRAAASRFDNQSRAGARNIKNLIFDRKVLIPLLIFFSIFPLACADLWCEGAVFSVIFVLSGIYVWLSKPEIETRKMLAPLFILAGYSFFQGLATILAQTGILPTFFPESFDPAASVWSALKITGFAFFAGLLIKIFRDHVGFLTWSLLFTGVFFALFGIARYLWQTDLPVIFENILSPRLPAAVGFGTYFNQNHFAFLMLMVFGLCSGLFLYGKQSKGARLFLLAAGLTTWCALVLTGSRGGIIGSFAEITVLLLAPLITAPKKSNGSEMHRSRILFAARQMAILLLLTGFLTIGIVLIGQDRVVGRFEEIPEQIGGATNAATFRRTDVWQAAIAVIKEFPVSGIGFGGFHVAVSQYIDISGRLEPSQAHNDYLELAASGGIIAVALAAFALYGFLSLVRKRFSEPSDSFSRAARVGAVCGMAGVGLHSFFDFGLQITANLLFFAALICIAVHPPRVKNSPETASLTISNNLFFKFFFSFLCLILACAAAYFGYARYQLEAARTIPDLETAEKLLYKIPFDAAYYETKAGMYENSGKIERAVSQLRTAIVYRPKDYNLWLKLGRLEQARGRETEAGEAFRRAVELARRYGKPHFYYGNFLLTVNQKTAGLAELRLASRRDPQYFTEVAGRVWLENAGNVDDVIKTLSPLDAAEREQFILFLFEKDEFSAIVQLTCREADLTHTSREALIRKMLEKKQYYFAHKIYKRDCDTSGSTPGEIEDAGFENGNVTEGTGFGWRVSLSDITGIGLDKAEAANGRSLRFDFNGQESSSALLSQILVVEKNRPYQLQFSTRTSGLITGTLPVLQVIRLAPGSEKIIGETKLSVEENKWTRFSIGFETDERTEAVELRLARPVCSEPLCPIYGKLWLDEFALQIRN